MGAREQAAFIPMVATLGVVSDKYGGDDEDDGGDDYDNADSEKKSDK